MSSVDAEILAEKLKTARRHLFGSGAHFVVDTINELPDIIEEINKRLEMGISP